MCYFVANPNVLYKDFILDIFWDGWYPPPGMESGDNQTSIAADKNNDAQINCGPKPSIVPHCGGEGYSPCLFNIKRDPCEYVDVSKKYPLIYNMMATRLEDYKKKMVKQKFTMVTDPKANPKLHDGVWVSWKDDV